MEFLIPGLILVALMAYASTRIKRNAARAFEAETVETDGYIVEKPDGFLNVLNGDPKYALEMYSKEFGTGDADRLRQATAKLTISEGGSHDPGIALLPDSGGEVLSDISEVVGDHRYRIIEAQRNENGVDLSVFYKIAEKNGKVYRLEITVLNETTNDLKRNIETMLDSFELK